MSRSGGRPLRHTSTTERTPADRAVLFLKKRLVRIPLLYRSYQGARAVLHRRNRSTLARRLTPLGDRRAQAIRRAIEALGSGAAEPDSLWRDRIEESRSTMLASSDPLVDGTLGESEVPTDKTQTVSDACRASKRRGPAYFLYLLVRFLRPRVAIELGTNVGISSAYLGAGIQEYSDHGQLVTLDSSAYRQRIAKSMHGDLGLSNITYVRGFFSETLGPTLARSSPVDFVFLDGHHQYQPTLDYVDTIVPLSTADCVFVFDDVRWSEGMRRAWEELKADARFGLVLDLHSVGICVVRQGTGERFVSERLRIF